MQRSGRQEQGPRTLEAAPAPVSLSPICVSPHGSTRAGWERELLAFTLALGCGARAPRCQACVQRHVPVLVLHLQRYLPVTDPSPGRGNAACAVPGSALPGAVVPTPVSPPHPALLIQDDVTVWTSRSGRHGLDVTVWTRAHVPAPVDQSPSHGLGSFLASALYTIGVSDSPDLREDCQNLGKSHLALQTTPEVVRKHIADGRESPQLTTAVPHGLGLLQDLTGVKMASEDCSGSVTKSRALHPERGQQTITISPDFAAPHEGSLLVPIPCAVLSVVIITSLAIALIALSGGSAPHTFIPPLGSGLHAVIRMAYCIGQYNCPVQYMPSEPSNSHVPSCWDDWIIYRRKCYFVSFEQKTWTSAQNECSQHGATLLAFTDADDNGTYFLQKYVGNTKHWIGPKNEMGQTQKQAHSNGQDNGSTCPFLNGTGVSSAGCDRQFHWICSKPSR
ncbi:Early activation antigen CD69 [Galemys pyrenaicus]|uniref:Early activation antigen CD69 n=1 Tax=Galemys pyrenaicus TaxID=202257 RepID=A0A8J5ZGH5_GALPY|nr:Early activation antigen CD69 [Galemys pyrenaicus]